MTGRELLHALRGLPLDALEQPVVFVSETHKDEEEISEETSIVETVRPFARVDDMNGNYILLS